MPTSKTLEVELGENEIDAIFASYNRCHLPGIAVGIAVKVNLGTTRMLKC